jgi:ABC-2 type transport system permease protein
VRRQLSLIVTLAVKDWTLFLSDKRGALLAFVVPVVLASAFGLIFARPSDRAATVKLQLMVAAEGDGPFTAAVINGLTSSDRIDAEVVPPSDVERRLADRRPGVAVILPADLESLADWRPSGNHRPRVAVRHNPLCASEGQWAEGLVAEVVVRQLANAKLGTAAGDPPVPFEVKAEEDAGAHAGFNSYTHSFSGMTLQYLLFWGMESGLLLLRDRQRSVWARLRAAPLPLGTLLVGKAVSTAGVAFLQVLTTFGFGYLAFGVTVGGSWVGFLLLAAAASVLAAATGLLVAAVGGTEARARSVCILVILGVSMLGGLWLPSFVLPGWARDLALALPTTWAMRGFDAVTWQGRGLVAALPSVAAVAAFAVAFLAVAAAQLVSSEARRRRGLA